MSIEKNNSLSLAYHCAASIAATQCRERESAVLVPAESKNRDHRRG
jgi:hypothetical protein